MGLREKFGREYPFTEFHWDNGPPFGTVSPIEELDEVLPDEIELTESEPTFCKNCKVLVKWQQTDLNTCKGVWHHLSETDCDDVYPTCFENRVLKAWLMEMVVKHKSKFQYIFTGELDSRYFISKIDEDDE
jgi:hypothetical protein